MINTKGYFVLEVLSCFEEFEFAFGRQLEKLFTLEQVLVVAVANVSYWHHQG
jgi:hypothetical protein